MVIVNYMFLKSGPGAQNKKNSYIFTGKYFLKCLDRLCGAGG